MNKKVIPIIITAIVAGGIAFYGGMQYGKGSATPGADMFQRGNRTGLRAGGGMRDGGGFIGGEILTKDDKSITVKMRDGSSKFVFFSTSTQVLKSSGGTPSDLTVGEQVTANGTVNADGSVVAQSIQIRPTQVKPVP